MAKIYCAETYNVPGPCAFNRWLAALFKQGILIIKPTRRTNLLNLFLEWNSVHHQEFFTVHTAMLYFIQVCWQLASRIRMESILILLAKIYSWNETLHVSDSSSVHHQDLFTVHTAMLYVIQCCWQLVSRSICSCSQAVSNAVWHILLLCVQ